MAVGEQVIVTVVGTVLSDASGSLVNYVNVVCQPTEPDYPACDNNEQFVTTEISAEADLNIQKDVSSGVITAGETFEYTITVENLGPSQAQGVIVTDALPEYVEYVDLSLNPESGPDPYVWNLGTINQGDLRQLVVTVKALSTLQDGLLITNEAAVSSTTDDTNPFNNTDEAQTQVFGVSEVIVDKAASANPVKAGESLIYTINAHNNGPSTAKNVEIKDLLPDGLTYVGVSSNPPGIFCSGDPAIVCQVGDMLAGEDVVITIETTVDPDVADGTVICNTAEKHPVEPDNENDSDQVCVDVQAEADLRITKVDSVDPVNAGDEFVYTIQIKNFGPSDAKNVSVTDTLPGKLNFISTSKTQTSGPNPLVWNYSAIPAGATRTINVTVKAKATASGTVKNTVYVVSDTDDPNPGNDSDEETTTITYNQTDLSITKDGPDDPVVIGSEFDYTITVKNVGPAVAENVVVVDDLPPDVSFVSAVPTPDGGPYRIVWNLGDMQPGEQKVITLTVYVEPWANEFFTNAVSASTDTTEVDYTNNEDDKDTVVPPNTAVTVTDFRLVKVDNEGSNN